MIAPKRHCFSNVPVAFGTVWEACAHWTQLVPFLWDLQIATAASQTKIRKRERFV